MDRSEIEEKIKRILVDKLRIDIGKITPETSLRDTLGMDSFGAVEVVFEIEDAFEVNVPQEEVFKIKTFNDMIEAVVKITADKND